MNGFIATACLLLMGLLQVNCTDSLESLMKQLEKVALRLRNQVEEQYNLRCAITKEGCTGQHYGCISASPNPLCKVSESGNEMWEVGACADLSCGSLWDWTESAVRVPEEVGGEDPDTGEVIETICFSKYLDEFFYEEFEKGQSGTYGDFEFRGMYYGAWNGAFRIFPARPEKVCNVYDPRYRPWYVAASSGPKNVIIIIDTSGSMDNYERMELAKDAAIDVLGTMTVADYIGVVEFSSTASTLRNTKLVKGTASNIAYLQSAVSGLYADGKTNFLAAFETAFDMLADSVASEKIVNCETAMLFLTDGTPTTGHENINEIYDLIEERNEDYGATMFTYSLGYTADVDISKNISCRSNGIWQFVPDGGNLREKMSGFYRYYAAGMGQVSNENFTAWVEPYNYATGTALGTTVSVPVYDRSTTPFRFLGAVGVDLPVDYMEEVAGGTDAYDTVLSALTTESQSFCPILALDECQIQSLREAASYDADVYSSVCDNQCSNYTDLTPEACLSSQYYPNGYDLWANDLYDDEDYVTKACCSADEDGQSSYAECDATAGGSKSGAVFSVAIFVQTLVWWMKNYKLC